MLNYSLKLFCFPICKPEINHIGFGGFFVGFFEGCFFVVVVVLHKLRFNRARVHASRVDTQLCEPHQTLHDPL